MVQAAKQPLKIREAELEALARIAKPRLYQHTANIAGFHRSRTLINGGSDYAGLREYSPGDEVRSINWRASARSAQFQVHQYQQERGARWFICLDISASMYYPESRKWQQALQLSDALAYILISAGNQVGLLAFSNRVEHYCPLGLGRLQYKKLHQLFEQLSPAETGGGSELHACVPYIKQRATVIVISDFLQHDFMLHGMERLFKAGHHLQVLQTIAVDEAQLNEPGLINLVDCETGESLAIESTAASQAIAKQTLEQHCHALAVHCAEKRIHYALVHSNRYWKEILVEYIRKL